MSQLPTRKEEAERSLCEIEGREYVRKPTVYFAVLIGILLILVAGLRWRVGTDYGGYMANYEGYAKNIWKALIGYKEPGICVVANIGKLIYDDYATYIFLCSVFTIGAFVMQIYKYSKMYPVCIMLFLFIGTWHGSFNGVRQYLAAAVLILGHRFIIDKKFVKYALIVFIASLFHTSALVMILPYFLLNRKISFKNMLIIVIGTIIIRYSYDFVFDLVGLYKGHEVSMSSYTTNSVNILRIGVAYAPLLVFLVFGDKKDLSKEETFYINGIILNAFAMFATMNSTYLARAGIYTEIFPVIGYGYLLGRIKDNRLRNIIVAVVLILFAAYWWYSISISPDLKTFKWIWNRTD